MQKYLEYFSFLQWPTGQLEKDFNLLAIGKLHFPPQNPRVEHEQSLGWGWKFILKHAKSWFSFPNEQIPTFLTTRASSGSSNSVNKEKNSLKLAPTAREFPRISKQQHYNKHRTDFLTPALA